MTETRSPVVLVAEDDPLLRHLLTISLETDRFRVIDASDGFELEAWVRRLIISARDQRCVDLIIADQRMPSLTGLEVLAHLRAVDWSMPFILITAFADEVTRAEARRLGASCVIDKPFDLDVIRAAALQYAPPGDA